MATNPAGFQNLMRTSIVIFPFDHSGTALQAKINPQQSQLASDLKKKIIAVIPLLASVPIFGFLCNLAKVLKKQGFWATS